MAAFIETEQSPRAGLREDATFPSKAHEMINQCDQHHPEIACWTTDGSAFVIKDEEKLKAYLKEYEVCRSQSGAPKYDSFVRQLNLYGFRKNKSTREVIFCNENFRKGRRDLLTMIHRDTPKKRPGQVDCDSATIQAKVGELGHEMLSLRKNMEESAHQVEKLHAKVDRALSILEKLFGGTEVHRNRNCFGRKDLSSRKRARGYTSTLSNVSEHGNNEDSKASEDPRVHEDEPAENFQEDFSAKNESQTNSKIGGDPARTRKHGLAYFHDVAAELRRGDRTFPSPDSFYVRTDENASYVTESSANTIAKSTIPSEKSSEGINTSAHGTENLQRVNAGACSHGQLRENPSIVLDNSVLVDESKNSRASRGLLMGADSPSKSLTSLGSKLQNLQPIPSQEGPENDVSDAELNDMNLDSSSSSEVDSVDFFQGVFGDEDQAQLIDPMTTSNSSQDGFGMLQTEALAEGEDMPSNAHHEARSSLKNLNIACSISDMGKRVPTKKARPGLITWVKDNAGDSAFAKLDALKSLIQDRMVCGYKKDSDAIASIAAAMLEYPHCMHLQQYGVTTLWMLARNNEQNKSKIIRSNALNAIVQGMEKTLPSLHVQQRGCAALWSLAVEKQHRPAIACVGGCDRVVDALARYGDSEELVNRAFGAAKSLSMDHRGRAKLELRGLSRAVVAAMTIHVKSARVQIMACSILSNLVVDTVNSRVLVGSPEEIDAIVRAMIKHPDDQDVQRKACFALQNYTFSDPNLGNLHCCRLPVRDLLESASRKYPEACANEALTILERLKQAESDLSSLGLSSGLLADESVLA